MQRDRDPENDLAPTPVRGRVDQLAGEVADGRAAGEQEAETPIPLRVEIIAGHDQHRFFRREAGVQHRHRRRDDEEEQQESEGREQHRGSAGGKRSGRSAKFGQVNFYHSEEVFRIASTVWRKDRQAEGSAGMPAPTVVSVPAEAGIEFASESITAKNSGMGVERGGAV